MNITETFKIEKQNWAVVLKYKGIMATMVIMDSTRDDLDKLIHLDHGATLIAILPFKEGDGL